MTLSNQHLDIINAACALLGADPVQSLEDDVDGAGAAGVLYLPVLEFNLGLYPWGFAKQLFSLSVNDQVVPNTGYRFAFDLPPEAIELPLYVTDNVKNAERRFDGYVLIDGKVHADANALWAMCRYRPDPQRWTPLFRKAMISSFAAALALPIAADRNARDDFQRQAYGTASESYKGGEIGAAMRSEAYSTPPRSTGWADNNVLINARRGG